MQRKRFLNEVLTSFLNLNAYYSKFWKGVTYLGIVVPKENLWINGNVSVLCISSIYSQKIETCNLLEMYFPQITFTATYEKEMLHKFFRHKLFWIFLWIEHSNEFYGTCSTSLNIPKKRASVNLKHSHWHSGSLGDPIGSSFAPYPASLINWSTLKARADYTFEFNQILRLSSLAGLRFGPSVCSTQFQRGQVQYFKGEYKSVNLNICSLTLESGAFDAKRLCDFLIKLNLLKTKKQI